MAKRVTKTQIVKSLLEGGGSISSMEAFEKHGITRLAAIIFSLRRSHKMRIETKLITGKDRFGNPVEYAEYFILV